MNSGREDMSGNPEAIRVLADQLTASLNSYRNQIEAVNSEITTTLATTWYGKSYNTYRDNFLRDKANILDPSADQLAKDIQLMYESADIIESGEKAVTNAVGK